MKPIPRVVPPRVIPPPKRAKHVVVGGFSGGFSGGSVPYGPASRSIPAGLKYGPPSISIPTTRHTTPTRLTRPTTAPHILAMRSIPARQADEWWTAATKGEDWKDWKNSSDMRSWDWTWNSCNSKEKWVQYERYNQENEESHTDVKQKAESLENEYSLIGQWANYSLQWEDEVNQDQDEYEWIRVEQEDNHNEEMIKTTRDVLKRHRRRRGKAPVRQSHRSRKQCHPLAKKVGRGRDGKAFSKHAKSKAILHTDLDDERELHYQVDVRELRYSQESCKETFQCGRSVSDLVDDLLEERVCLSEPFLRLTVFETPGEKAGESILRCIDNRRLFALKEYARRSGKDSVMVNINIFSLNTLVQVHRFIQNSDDTDGRNVRLRGSGKGSKKGRNRRP